MKIIKILKMRRYALIAAVAFLIFSSLYVYTQVLGIVQNIDLWFVTIPRLNLLLFTIFASLFAITVSFQVYNWQQKKVCNVKSVGTPSSAGVLSLFVAQCPACASLGALFLPLSITTFLTKYSVAIDLLSISLLLFTIHYLGGFRNE
ncbi:MAG: hypothetical protein HY368_00230 [Candidatus Aenigmarchaeota archaeon]|nr:hypothetical protein [Candidatus Aenigmarchaeota archaeon]